MRRLQALILRPHMARVFVMQHLTIFLVTLFASGAHSQGAGPNYAVGNTKAKAVHIREGPSARSDAVAYVKPGAIVGSTGECDPKWCEVLFRDKKGWMFRTFLTPTQQQAEVAADPAETDADAGFEYLTVVAESPSAIVKMQEWPGAGRAVVGFIPSDAGLIESLKTCVPGWCLVRYQQVEGWVAESELRLSDGGSLPPDFAARQAEGDAEPGGSDADAGTTANSAAGEPTQIAALNQAGAAPEDAQLYSLAGLSPGAALPMRGEPSPDAPVVGSIPHTATNIAGMKQCVRQWCRVRYEGATGFILRRHLARNNADPNLRYRVDAVAIEAVLNVYDFPGVDASAVGAIPAYATGIVPIGGCDREWCHVRYFGVVGWVNSRYLATENAVAN